MTKSLSTQKHLSKKLVFLLRVGVRNQTKMSKNKSILSVFNSSFTETYLRKTIATSKMKPFDTIVGGFQLLTNVTKNSILGVAGVLDPPQKHYITCFARFAGVPVK